MSLTMDLAPEIEAALRKEADRHGVDAAQYVARLVEQYVTPSRVRLTP